MCRHLAYLGTPRTLQALLIDPPHSLFRQSWEPARQTHGVVNADGFGVGWFADADPVPARYRQGVPIWADPSFPDVARVTRSGAVLAAVRDATTGSATGTEAAAPYLDDNWLFSHNGAVTGYPKSVAKLAEEVPAADLLALESRTDAAFVWTLIRTRARAGTPMDEAVASVVSDIAALTSARLNLLMMNDTTIVASVFGDSLSALSGDGFTVVASEPYDDSPGWVDVAEGVHTWTVEGMVEGR